MTVSDTPSASTVWPIGEPPPKSSSAVVAPRTVTSAAPESCGPGEEAALGDLPVPDLSHDGVVPTTEVVQLLRPSRQRGDRLSASVRPPRRWAPPAWTRGRRRRPG